MMKKVGEMFGSFLYFHAICNCKHEKPMNEVAVIQSMIYEIRGQRVMLDFDLAVMYGVETKC